MLKIMLIDIFYRRSTILATMHTMLGMRLMMGKKRCLLTIPKRMQQKLTFLRKNNFKREQKIQQ